MSDVDLVLKHLETDNVFLTGGAGVGKSYTTTKIIEIYDNDTDKQVIPLGSTGVSAVNIGGFTVHSFFVFGISSNFDELQEQDRRSRSRLSELKKILKGTDLIIIDEISMVSANMMEMIDYRLSSLGYLGKLLFVGDFFQLPPIQKYGKKATNLFDERVYAFESDAWMNFSPTIIELTVMRRTSDREFTNILHKIRIGKCDNEVINYMLKLSSNEIKEKNPTFLFGRNMEVDVTNTLKLQNVESSEKVLDALFEEHQKGLHEKRIATWKKLLPIQEKLTLKIGVPILFTVNKWGKYANGERGVIRHIAEDSILVEKDNQYFTVDRYDFDLIEMRSEKNGKVESVKLATLSQFPIKLAYAVTIHKSQGMSIDNLVCNVDNIFAPSQFYVAISRAINPKNLKLEFSRGNIVNYLRKVIRVDERVVEYYKEINKIK